MNQFAGRLADALSQLDLTLESAQQQQLLAYLALLDKWNHAYNLTAVREPEQMLVRHLFDSLAIVAHLGDAQSVIDVGTGPGLPGVVLAIAEPQRRYTLLDSLGKRILFLRQVKHQLQLPHITPLQSRVEQHRPEQPYDVIVSRAFASISDMLNWCGHLGQRFLAMKGQYPEQELASLPHGFTVHAVHELQVPDLHEARHLIEIHRN